MSSNSPTLKKGASFLPGQRKSPEDKPAKAVAHSWPSPVRPSVLLIPRTIQDRRDKKAQKRKLIAAGAGGVAVVALITAGLGAYAGVVNHQLDDSRQAGAQLTAQANALKPVGDYYDSYSAQKKALSDVVVSDVAYSKILNQLAAPLPAGAFITSENTAYGTSCEGPSPFVSSENIGCVTLKITPQNLTDSIGYLNAIQESQKSPDSVITDAYITDTKDFQGLKTFTLTANFNAQALSQKFTSITTPTGQAAAPAPVAAPTTP